MTTHIGPARDLVGYGEHPPNARWPKGARVAVNIVMNYEEGSEYSVPDRDGFSERELSDSTSNVREGGRDLTSESVYEFGSRVGFWRLSDLFREYRVPITVFACALALERNPAAAARIVADGHDVCCHGWRWIEHYLLTPEEERRHIADAVASLQKTVGQRPLGWFCRTGPSVHTRALLVEEGGFLYDSDAYNDELPYWVRVAGKPHLVIPYTADTNDSKFLKAGGFTNGEDFFVYLRDSFDTLYREGEKTPKMMSVGLHMRLAGRPGRIAGLRRFLDHVLKHDHAWVCRRLDIACHWAAHHPAP